MVGSIVQDVAVLPLGGDAEEGKQAGKPDYSVHGKEGGKEQVDVVDHVYITNIFCRVSGDSKNRSDSGHY